VVRGKYAPRTLLTPRRVVSLQRGEQFRFPQLEPLHPELEPVAVALPEPVVVQLPHETGEVAVLKRVRKLRGWVKNPGSVSI
jgi:hypothetical protein